MSVCGHFDIDHNPDRRHIMILDEAGFKNYEEFGACDGQCDLVTYEWLLAENQPGSRKGVSALAANMDVAPLVPLMDTSAPAPAPAPATSKKPRKSVGKKAAAIASPKKSKGDSGQGCSDIELEPQGSGLKRKASKKKQLAPQHSLESIAETTPVEFPNKSQSPEVQETFRNRIMTSSKSNVLLDYFLNLVT